MSELLGRSNVPSGYVVGFDQQLQTGETNEFLGTCARVLLDGLSPSGWERAGLIISDCIAGGEFDRLCDYDPDVLDLSSSDVAIIVQCLAFFKKRQDMKTYVDKEAAAWEKFQEAERSCSVTNQCFRAWKQGRFQFLPVVERVLHAAQRKISGLLEHINAPLISEIRPRFGPGSSTQTEKQNACAVVKLNSMPACSANFNNVDDALSSIFVTTSVEEEQGRVDIHCARVSFVPKNSKTYRAICTEPQLNGMFQLGLGDMLAQTLRRVGIDISDQSHNQRAALYGSISGEVATLDLSSASDTVSIGLVEHLFPPDWFDLFMSLRSAEAVYKGQLIHLQKISSMGNGFTFPLETIIFWAIASSCSEIYAPRSQRRVLAYGDDIIVPTLAALPTMAVLSSLGFTPNLEKSFWQGPFRESCGSDYHLGTNVRPVFVDDALTGADLFRLYNFFLVRHEILCPLIKSLIHPSIHLVGPSGYGDGHMHVSAGESVPLMAVTRKGWGGFTFETFTRSVKHLRSEVANQLAFLRRLSVPVWDQTIGDWSKERTETVTRRVYHARSAFVVRRLATYTQMQRDKRELTLTRVDSAMNCGQHVYCDRRMPDPIVHSDDDYFVVPGEGPVVRTKVYIFESPSLA